MILEVHYPVHKHTKGVTLPQFPEVNEVNLKSVSEILFEKIGFWLPFSVLVTIFIPLINGVKELLP